MALLKLLPLLSCLLLLVYQSNCNNVTIGSVTKDMGPLLKKILMIRDEGSNLPQPYSSKATKGCLMPTQIGYSTYALNLTETDLQCWDWKWSWAGKQLRTDTVLANLTEPSYCLAAGEKSGPLQLAPCTQNLNQNFTTRVLPNQINFEKERISYSIFSDLYPTRCLTYSPRSTIYSADYKQNLTMDMFTLQECTGREAQSFFNMEIRWDYSESSPLRDFQKQ